MGIKWEGISNHKYLMSVAIRNEKWYLPVTFLYIVLNFSAPFILLIPPKYILDDLSSGKNIAEVLPTIVLMAGLYFIVNASIKGIQMVKLNLELKLKVCLNVAISDKCMRIEYSDFEQNETINTINNARIAVNGGLTYAQSIGLSGSQGIGGYFTQLCDLSANIMKIIATFYVLNRLDSWVVIIIMSGLIINVICGVVKKKMDVTLRNYAAPFLRKNQYCNRILRSVEAGKDIRLYDLENYFIDKFSECNNNYIIAKNTFRNRYILTEIISVVCNGCVMVSVFLGLFSLIPFGSMTVGSFTMLSGAAISLFAYGSAIITEIIDLDIHMIYMQDYRKLMHLQVSSKKGSKKLTSGEHNFRFENVSFIYKNTKKNAIDNINITINQGETISVVGVNGAGKSTFIKLMTGLYKPTKGCVYIDDTPIEEYDRESLTECMSVLFQDFNTYAMNVEENISLTEHSEKGRIEKSLRESGMLERVKRMNSGVKTPIKELFSNNSEFLSGGEEQKMALARAFYKNADLLILDEPTASLDAIAECEIYTSILKYLHGQTVLFVSHRMASSRFCNRILVFDNGKIVEDGDHSELLEFDGIYRKMWYAQSKYYENFTGEMI